MLSKTRALINLNRVVYSSIFENATSGVINITDDSTTLDINGNFRILYIKYKGNVYIKNNLPEGYSIRVNQNTIRIMNLLGKQIKNNKVLFNFDGYMEINKAQIVTFNSNKFLLDIQNINKLNKIENSKTNVEDDTLLIFPEYQSLNMTRPAKNAIDDDTIKGLYTDKKFKNNYKGYYNYSPSSKIFSTGRQITNESVPFGNKSVDYANKFYKENVEKITSTLNYKTQEQKYVKKTKEPTKFKKVEKNKRGKY